jgi:hypothetical protein
VTDSDNTTVIQLDSDDDHHHHASDSDDDNPSHCQWHDESRVTVTAAESRADGGPLRFGVPDRVPEVSGPIMISDSDTESDPRGTRTVTVTRRRLVTNVTVTVAVTGRGVYRAT